MNEIRKKVILLSREPLALKVSGRGHRSHKNENHCSNLLYCLKQEFLTSERMDAMIENAAVVLFAIAGNFMYNVMFVKL